MLKQYPKFKRNQIEKIFDKLPKTSRDEINKYIAYRESTGLQDSSDVKRYIIQIRYILECDFKEFNTLEDVVKLSNLIKSSYLSNTVKSNLKINLKNLFQYIYPDWTSRFMGLKCFNNKKLLGDALKEETFTAEELPTEEDDKKILQTEKTNYWKTFFLVHSQSGNRTIETRTIENSKIKFSDDGCEIEILMTKNGKKKFNILNKQAADYIKKLQEEQKNTGTFGKYLFNSAINSNEPITKNPVNEWFRNISKKATGRILTPYMWRHRKAGYLYGLATENKISLDAAAKLMGHGKDMASSYVHRPDNQTIEMLKSQLKNIDTEISPERKHELEEKIENQDKEIENLKKQMQFITKQLVQEMDEHSTKIEVTPEQFNNFTKIMLEPLKKVKK